MDRVTVGWREWVSLPELGIDQIKAKVDTGARTSSLHAYNILSFSQQGRSLVRFYLHPFQRQSSPAVLCEAPLIDERMITSSSGHRERRYVIETRLRIGQVEWPIEVTLTNRDEMGFRMLIGRQAMRRRLVVDPGSSYKLSKPRRRQQKPVEGKE